MSKIFEKVSQSLDVAFILYDRIVETILRLENDLCPIAASSIAKNPSIIVFGFYN